MDEYIDKIICGDCLEVPICCEVIQRFGDSINKSIEGKVTTMNDFDPTKAEYGTPIEAQMGELEVNIESLRSRLESVIDPEGFVGESSFVGRPMAPLFNSLRSFNLRIEAMRESLQVKEKEDVIDAKACASIVSEMDKLTANVGNLSNDLKPIIDPHIAVEDGDKPKEAAPLWNCLYDANCTLKNILNGLQI